MNEAGITIDEACANNVIGTEEDFERNCNPDGSVKKQSETTTISLKNSDKSVTLDNAYIQFGLAVAVVTVLLILGIIIRKKSRKSGK